MGNFVIFCLFRVLFLGNSGDTVFQGTSLLVLDGKGRMKMPARHRDVLTEICHAQVTLTRHPDGCVLIYPKNVWEEKRAALAALPFNARVLQRIVLGSAVDLELDSAGRLLIPRELRALCGLDREVSLVGIGEHFELWNTAKLMALEEQALTETLSDTVANFNF